MAARLTKADAARLGVVADLLATQLRRLRGQWQTLSYLLESAHVVDPTHFTADLVTMNSRVFVEEPHSKESMEFELVFPEHLDPAAGRISVLSVIGSALLGRSVGERVAVHTDKGSLNLHIVAITNQPEAIEL